jgi:hypothetical protein
MIFSDMDFLGFILFGVHIFLNLLIPLPFLLVFQWNECLLDVKSFIIAYSYLRLCLFLFQSVFTLGKFYLFNLLIPSSVV